MHFPAPWGWPHCGHGSSVSSWSVSQQATTPTSRDLALAKSWRERLLLPLLQRLYGAGNALTPARNVEQLRRDLSKAGLFDSLTVLDFLGLRFLAGAEPQWLGLCDDGILSAAAFRAALGRGGFSHWPLFAQLLVAQPHQQTAEGDPCAPYQMHWIEYRSVLTLVWALRPRSRRVSAEWEGELASELRHVIGEIRLGVPRVEALRHLADRTGVDDVASFVAVLVQAERLGVAIRDVLHSQSVRMRDRRRQRAEEAANQAPIKMLIPLTLFIFPAMFAVILGPAIPQIMAAFK